MPAAAAAAALLVAGCAGAGGPQPPVPAPAACTIAAAEPAAVDTVEVIIDAMPATGHESAHPLFAPFGGFHETLVTVDCAGNVAPGLAARWAASANGTRFTLAGGARFWNGEPVTARDVAQSIAGRSVGSFHIGSVTVVADDALEVRHDALDVASFAAPGLAVTKEVAGTSWPIGTGAYTLVALETTQDGAVRQATGRARAAGIPASVLVSAPASSDLRDAIDAGADIVVTRSPEALAYARRLNDFDVAPLPWDRRYLLVTRAPADLVAPPRDLGTSLARDVVRPDARAVPDGDAAGGECVPMDDVGRSSVPAVQPVIAYPRSDAAAGALAERLAALAGAPGNEWLTALLGTRRGERVHAAGLAHAAFTAALESGENAAVVVPTAIDGLGRTDGCPASQVVERAAWLRAGGVVTPLVDTRPHLVRRRGVGPVRIDAFGNFRFVPPTGAER